MNLYHDFCTACAVTVTVTVIFGHLGLSRSFYLVVKMKCWL